MNNGKVTPIKPSNRIVRVYFHDRDEVDVHEISSVAGDESFHHTDTTMGLTTVDGLITVYMREHIFCWEVEDVKTRKVRVRA